MLRLLPLLFACAFGCSTCTDPASRTRDRAPGAAPNIILIFADDLGYGDLSSYGSPVNETPNIDRLGYEGARLTDFYAFPVCSPSRAALLTGNYPDRVGIPHVLAPPGQKWAENRQYGLHPDHTTTVAEVLKARGYATGMVGKWHLGHFPETMPNRHGFDYYYGLPYSNDMRPEQGYTDLPLMRNDTMIQANPDQRELTANYHAEALDFIRRNADTSFFLYLAHSMPHVPLYTSAGFTDRTGRGVYADVLAEIDDGVGQLLAALDTLGLDENTLVIFTSDNGPWLSYGNHAGSSGPFREGKGTTMEGGMRVPFLARWPGTIPPSTVSHTPASVLDVFPTLGAAAGAEGGVETDGGSVLPLLRGETAGDVERPFFYWHEGEVQAVRRGRWKLHVPHMYRTLNTIGNDAERGSYNYTETIGPALFNLLGDPSERNDVAERYPGVVADLRALVEEHRNEIMVERVEPWRPVVTADGDNCRRTYDQPLVPLPNIPNNPRHQRLPRLHTRPPDVGREQ